MRTREGLPFGHPGCPVTGKRSGRFIDTGKSIRVGGKMEQLFVHEAGVQIMARQIGMLTREENADQAAELIALKHRVSQLEDELAEADAFIDGTEALVQRGLVVRKAPGRPKKQQPTKD